MPVNLYRSFNGLHDLCRMNMHSSKAVCLDHTDLFLQLDSIKVAMFSLAVARAAKLLALSQILFT